MFDVGWSELLIIAVVLIVVVGPKDLPPMLRAFGKMTSRARKVAGEFRAQFDEALREAELDDVRQTIADAQKLNPMNSLREAMNPLRQMGNDIKADLQKASSPNATPATPSSDPSMGLPETPLMTPIVSPAVPEPAIAPAPVVAPPPAVVTEEVVKAKVARKPRAKAPAKTEAAAAVPEVVAEKPKRAPRKTAAVSAPVSTASDEPVAATPKKRAPARKKDNA
jgi:sec-independent protein translocase protein TatB